MPFLFPPLAPPPALAAVGDWSAPVADNLGRQIRGRLRVTQGRPLGPAGAFRETAIYLELENVTDAVGNPIEIPFDVAGGALRPELKDSRGKPLPQAPGPGSSFVPEAARISIPYDSAVRLRANHPGFGSPDGLMVPLSGNQWLVKPGEVAYLSATFTVVAPQGDAGFGKWRGTLELPAVRLAVPRRQSVTRR